MWFMSYYSTVVVQLTYVVSLYTVGSLLLLPYTTTFVWTDEKYLEFGLKIIKMMWFLCKFTFILQLYWWMNWQGVIKRINRKHAPCLYRVMETWVEVWENEKCCGNTICRRVFPQLFRVLPNFHECLYNSIQTRSTCFLFLLENNATIKRKTICKLWLSTCKFSLLASLLRQRALVLCFHRVIQTRLLTNQRVLS